MAVLGAEPARARTRPATTVRSRTAGLWAENERRARAARSSWHVGTDWVEAFAPLVYEQVDDQLRAQRAANEPDSTTCGRTVRCCGRRFVLVDDVPVYGRDVSTTARGVLP